MVSIPYWLGSKLRGPGLPVARAGAWSFQSPIGWGLSCEGPKDQEEREMLWAFQFPYWLGSKLRGWPGPGGKDQSPGVSIPYWLGSKLRAKTKGRRCRNGSGFNPLLVGV